MSVQVKLFMTLVPLSKSKKPQFELPWRDGLTVADILDHEGFFGDDREAIAAVVNSEQAAEDSPLADGDRVDLMVNLQGGASEGGPSEGGAV